MTKFQEPKQEGRGGEAGQCEMLSTVLFARYISNFNNMKCSDLQISPALIEEQPLCSLQGALAPAWPQFIWTIGLSVTQNWLLIGQWAQVAASHWLETAVM